MGATASLQRFFLDTTWAGVGSVVDLTPLHHQLGRVLRAQPGTQLVLLDGRGHACLAEVVQIDRRSAAGQVMALLSAPPEPRVPVTLYQCALKADKLEWVWQKGTELGVTHFAPVVSRRTVVRPVAALASKHDRWSAIVREAAEQAQRGAVPALLPAMTFDDAIRTAQGTRLMPWEGAGQLSGIGAALAQTQPPPTAVSLLIGPEGGLDTDEVDAAAAAGWQVVTLGRRILRAETAALAAVTLVMQAAGELGTTA
jgi:16S rRNA (uracil1498-N3)-methyltransferase